MRLTVFSGDWRVICSCHSFVLSFLKSILRIFYFLSVYSSLLSLRFFFFLFLYLQPVAFVFSSVYSIDV
ncbi:hypothetical protein EDB82DRAFT_502899 [Fusarium venenatum]|uniref:uncharacterized protein n=1 Tax=Fusarium venenatum TaxID=56646 RepID=UPI001DEACEEE|nr:hypothetical protein EDB82DRAFT_502899 [Fusarium venenatum]